MTVRLVQENPSQNTLTVDVPLTQDVSYFSRFSLEASLLAYKTSQTFNYMAQQFPGLTRFDVKNKDNYARVSLVWGTRFWPDQEKRDGLNLLSRVNQWVSPRDLVDNYSQLGSPDPERATINLVNNELAQPYIADKFDNDGGEFILHDVDLKGPDFIVSGILFGSCADCQVAQISTLNAIRQYIEHEVMNNFKNTPPFSEDPKVKAIQAVKMQPLTVRNGFYTPRMR